MKHYVKKSPTNIHQCDEPCPITNSPELLEIHKKTEGNHFRSLRMIGSGGCQGCEHHKNNHKVEDIIQWIECDKLDEYKKTHSI